MNPTELKKKFLDEISAKFPSLDAQTMAPLISDQLLSPHVIKLPQQILTQAQSFVSAIFTERQKPEYIHQFSDELHKLDLHTPGNRSILMSYDFHVDENGILKLIEINTNASFLALGDFMYKAQAVRQPIVGFSMLEIKDNILEELKLNAQERIRNPRIAIIDEDPSKQRLYSEFLIFSEYFKSWGWECSILDFKNLTSNFDFIYNRYTDFFFKNEASLNLRRLFNSGLTFSPNPAEYLMLADKSRMIEWSQKDLGPAISNHLAKCRILDSSNLEEIWSLRKNLFLKPRRSYGAKQTYRAAKISRKLFEEISNQDFVAQEYVAPPTIMVATDTGEQEFKYDLRFYAYQGRVQSVVGRIYQGQVTNLKSAYGGFACVEFKD